MYQEKLQKIGLSKNQADIYTTLISDGEQKGSELAKKIGISRQLTYKVLDELFDLDLIEKKKTAGASGTFLTTHPSKLETLLQQQEKEIKTAQQELSTTINNLISDYNLVSGKPGVQFFEGVEGFSKVLEDTLKNNQEIIYAYVDSSSITDPAILNLDEKYVKQRLKKKIKKKILMADNSKSRKYLAEVTDKFTEIKLVKNKNIKSFSSTMQIYNDKVAFVTYKKEKMTITVINNNSIYRMHRFFFEALWNIS